MDGFNSIPFEEAVNYVLRFKSQRDLTVVATTMAIGGTIRRETFFHEDQNKIVFFGTTGWFCYNKDRINEFPELFLAFECDNVSYNTDDPPPSNPLNEVLHYHDEICIYDGVASFRDIQEFLLTHTELPGEQRSISKENVITFKSHFLNSFPSRASNPHNIFDCAFFENADIQSLINQGPHIRYYFGYDCTPSQNQKIRLILFSVDESGRNITRNADNTGDAIILERNWPPVTVRPRHVRRRN